MKCKFNHSKECTVNCEYFKSCTRKSVYASNIADLITENHSLCETDETDCFEHFLENKAGVKRTKQILDILNSADNLFLTEKMISISIFEMINSEIVRELLVTVRKNRSIRSNFKGSCVLLECGLINLIDYYDNAKSQTKTHCLPENMTNQFAIDPDNIDDEQSNFLLWCKQNNYKIGTIKGYKSAINCVNKFIKENKICEKNIYEIIYPNELCEVIEKVKCNSNFKKFSQAHFIHALNVYMFFLNNKISLDETCNSKNKIDTTHVSRIDEIYKIIKRCDNIGLYSKQISDALVLDNNMVEKVLDSAPWCMKKNKKYFYNPNEDFSIENCSFMNETVDNESYSKQISQTTKFEDEEKIYLLKTDLDGLIKKLRENKKLL